MKRIREVLVVLGILFAVMPVHSARSDGPTYLDMTQNHEVIILEKIGLLKDAYSRSYIDLPKRKIHHNAVATTADFGGIKIFVNDKDY